MRGVKANGEKRKPYFKHTTIYAKKGDMVRTFPNVLAASEEFGVHKDHIYKCCNGKKTSVKGWAWSYKPFPEYEDDGRIWKDIKGYEGLYQVSTDGCVRTSYDGLWKILALGKMRHNYWNVSLYKDGKSKNARVHRLVAEAFLPNPNNYPFVNHKDENPSNNNVENLEWCTAKYNSNYGTSIQRISEKQMIPVLMFTLDGTLLKKFEGIIQIEKELGFHHSNIVMCCKGRTKSAYGYLWLHEADADTLNHRLSLINNATLGQYRNKNIAIV